VWASLCEMLDTNFRERRPLTNFGKHAKRAAPWEVRRLCAKVDRCDFTVLQSLRLPLVAALGPTPGWQRGRVHPPSASGLVGCRGD
jgi:hypothetical protein